MDLVVYSQYYRTRTPGRQLELDECLRRNLNHPGISRMVLFCENDAPPLPEGMVPVEVVASDERITYAEWFRWVKRQDSGIALLLNADIYLDEGLEQITATSNSADGGPIQPAATIPILASTLAISATGPMTIEAPPPSKHTTNKNTEPTERRTKK